MQQRLIYQLVSHQSNYHILRLLQIISYTTKSYAAEGGVGSLNLTFGGANYKKLPEFVSIASTNGINADIIPVSETVGRINEFTINDQGFDFSADKTLNPEVYITKYHCC